MVKKLSIFWSFWIREDILFNSKHSKHYAKEEKGMGIRRTVESFGSLGRRTKFLPKWHFFDCIFPLQRNREKTSRTSAAGASEVCWSLCLLFSYSLYIWFNNLGEISITNSIYLCWHSQKVKTLCRHGSRSLYTYCLRLSEAICFRRKNLIYVIN